MGRGISLRRLATKLARSTAAWGCAALVYAVLLIAAAGLDPVRSLERAGGGAATGWDKVLHASAFFAWGLVLGRFFALALPQGGGTTIAVLVVVTGSGYAALHEGIQLLLPGFTFNPFDLAADLLGAALSAGLVAAVLHRRAGTDAAPG